MKPTTYYLVNWSLTTIIVCAAIAAVLGTLWLLTRWLKSARCADLFRTWCAVLTLPGILLLCLVGVFAALARMRSLDRWCARQLTDTDGQTEN